MAPPLPTPGATATEPTDDTRLAVEVRTLTEQGRADEARERFAGLVTFHQRRASRIAYQYLRDIAESDESVQDAFVKAFTRIGSYRDEWPFEVWFTRILVNTCLDRRKARARRERWFAPAENVTPKHEVQRPFGGAPDLSPEAHVLGRERRARLASAIDRLQGRQRTVFMLCHFADHSPREVSAMTGLKESTVRVHLFRAARKLRSLLGKGQ